MGRPIVGLALGGGSARGWAHIGALNTLIAAGVEPDVVVGTSIGAVAGACYVTGTLDRLETFARSLTRRRIFGFLDFNLAGSGLITGQRLSGQLENHLQRFADRGSFLASPQSPRNSPRGTKSGSTRAISSPR